MLREIARPGGCAVSPEIGGRGADDVRARGEPPRMQPAGCARGDADRDVVALGDQVDGGVVENEVDVDLGIELEKAAELARDAAVAERRRRADAQPPVRAGVKARGLALGEIELLHDAPAVGVELAADLGEAEPPGRAIEKADAEVALERRDALADGRLRHPEAERGRREAALIDDPNEHGDGGQVFHTLAVALRA